MTRVHLDHNATTPLRPEARAELLRAIDALGGNPSSVHASGRAARAELDDARERIAAALEVDSDELIFTSGGTEANNAALFGAAPAEGAVLISAAEHSSVREAALALGASGREVRLVSVDPEGLLDLGALEAALRAGPVSMLSCVGANNEVGAAAPFPEIRAALDACQEGAPPAWHADCVQMLGKVPVKPAALGLDLASFSAHKVGGPLGVGLLWCAKERPFSPRMVGGGQESGLRSGTENLPAIAAAAVAIELAVQEQADYAARTQALTGELWRGIQELIPAAQLVGPSLEAAGRLPNTLCVLLPGQDGRVLVPRLDLAGLEVSAGSACSSGSIEPSPVLLALGHDESAARAALRLSLGRDTTAEEVRSAIRTLGTTCG
ncbi:MAG: cysteine desulfurase [Planctomycetes bacterium]|nr:cysteine desulfurase [Planctomycetota bacterium]